MKNFYKTGLIVLSLIISQQVFPQKENLKSMTDSDQQIEVVEGYSFISSRIIAENPDILNVLASILNENLDFVRDSEGNMLRKIGPNWVNGIGNWIVEEGYLIKVFSDNSFSIEGNAVDPTSPVQLETGFQFVSYFPETTMDALLAFETILSENLDFIRNSQGAILRKIGPNWVNGIGDCNSGEGYLVKMLADDILIYPGSSSFTCGDPFTDPRNEQTYNTVLIGDQCWMAENLNLGEMIEGTEAMADDGVIEKYCYNDDPANCETFGGLYQWDEMMQYTSSPGVQGICPDGWYIPTDDEWKILEGTVDSQYPVGDPEWDNEYLRGFDVGKNLKSTSGWTNNGNGVDLYEFTALPAGARSVLGFFFLASDYAVFWSSTGSGINAWYRILNYANDQSQRSSNYYTSYGFSVRCLKENFTPVNQAPEPPNTPNPEEGSENQSIESDLSWTCTDPEGDPLTYDIYFGTEATPPLVASGQTATTYDPGTLESNTEYLWKIIAHDDHSNTTEGPVWSFSTINEEWQCGNPFTDPRDEQIYTTVQIGDQCWMAENLSIGTMIIGTEEMTDNGVIEKYCYDNDPSNCETYGGLYQWNETMQYTTTQAIQGICPSDWHLPSDDEWNILEGTVDSQYPVGDPVWNGSGWRGYDVGVKLKSTTSWYSGGNGTNDFGFTALPGGSLSDGYFHVLTESGYFWSSSEGSSTYAWYRCLKYDNDEVFRYNYDKNHGRSVRCLHN